MRILEFSFGAESDRPIELHPNLTVVQGFDEDRRGQFAAAVNAISRGEAAGSGLIEAHGVLFDLTAESLKVLGLSSGLDVIVRSVDLPGHDRDAARAANDLVRAETDRESKLVRLDRARRAQASVNEARATLVAAIAADRQADIDRAGAVVEATTRLAHAQREQARLRSRREAAESAVADAEAARQALLDSRSATSDALARARQRQAGSAGVRAAAAAATEDAVTALTEYEDELRAARKAVAAAEKARAAALDSKDRAVEVEPVATSSDVAEPVVATGRLFSGGEGASHRGGVALSAEPRPAAAGGGDDDPFDDPAARLAALEERRREAGAELGALSTAAQTDQVRAARDHLVALGPSPSDPQVDQARALADRWRGLARQLDAIGWDRPDQGQGAPQGTAGVPKPETGDALPRASNPQGAAPTVPTEPVPEPAAIVAARAQLAKAGQTRHAAQTIVDASSMDPEDVRTLEDAHTAVLDAQERTEGRFGGAKAQRKLEQARSAEREILDRFGFTTYADYMMSVSSRFSNGADDAVLDTATRALLTARRSFVKAWRTAYGEEPESIPCPPRAQPQPESEPPPETKAEANAETEPATVAPATVTSSGQDGTATPAELAERQAALLTEQQELRASAETLTGQPAGPDVAADLDAHCRAFGPPPDHATDELADLLEHQGLAVKKERLARGTLVQFADAWLSEQQLSTWRRAELEAELDQIDRDCVRAQDTLAVRRDHVAAGQAAAAESRSKVVATAANDLGNARRRLAELEAADHGALAERVERGRAELEVRTTEVQEAAEALDQAEAAVVEVATVDQVAAAEKCLVEAERALEQAAAEEATAAAEVAEVQRRVAGDADAAEQPLAHLQARLDAVDEDRNRIEAELISVESELEMVEHTLQAMAEAESNRRQERARSQLTKGSLLEDIDWYLLSRLASQRSVSVVGSLPLVIDDAFSELPPTEANWLLGRLERMTGAVQVIVLTDRAESASWANGLGIDRAAVVYA